MNGSRRRVRAQAVRRPVWPWLALGLGAALAASAHGQTLPSSPPDGGVNRGVAPLPNGSTPLPSTGIAPPASPGVVTPPLVDPGMKVAAPPSGGVMPVIHPQAMQPNGTVVVPK